MINIFVLINDSRKAIAVVFWFCLGRAYRKRGFCEWGFETVLCKWRITHTCTHTHTCAARTLMLFYEAANWSVSDHLAAVKIPEQVQSQARPQVQFAYLLCLYTCVCCALFVVLVLLLYMCQYIQHDHTPD